eukprot:CAMPEP_0176076418 /NCGR_PEP_ID=MMETSP0120_2-20121206/38202_1 /TAXON_ID=160619 /ORGANISM="Kryptoperidinium foliaceum, Strain CCMP 1326" /LENGTH=224 /DNA_ID=CAMNT_0017410137 /DNA_START=564 /DNA_END=1234 /DNA_ORIENTATION=+
MVGGVEDQQFHIHAAPVPNCHARPVPLEKQHVAPGVFLQALGHAQKDHQGREHNEHLGRSPFQRDVAGDDAEAEQPCHNSDDQHDAHPRLEDRQAEPSGPETEQSRPSARRDQVPPEKRQHRNRRRRCAVLGAAAVAGASERVEEVRERAAPAVTSSSTAPPRPWRRTRTAAGGRAEQEAGKAANPAPSSTTSPSLIGGASQYQYKMYSPSDTMPPAAAHHMWR